MSNYPPGQLPAHDKLADADDDLGWDVEVHGRFADYATDEAPATVAYDPGADPFLTGEG